MPELPEVETIVRRLRNGGPEHIPVIGQIISHVEVNWKRIIATPSPEEFKKNLVGKQITDVLRRGKFLHFPLNNGHLFGHLRMSGDIRMEKRLIDSGDPKPVDKYDQVIFNFDSPWRMVFSNVRKFGRMWFVEDPETVIGHLGPEPLSNAFTADRFYKMVHSHNRQIKPLLLDQSFIAGLGNIYTDEALFEAKIHPIRQSDSLSKEEAFRLYQSIQLVLREGIRRLGASLDWVYRGGEFQNYFKVYKRQGESCYICGTAIEKITVGQRGTHFCPTCQESPQE